MRAPTPRVLAATAAVAGIAIIVAVVAANPALRTSAPAPSPPATATATATSTPSATPTAAPSPSPTTPATSPTARPSRSPISFPTSAQLTAPSSSVVWVLVGGQALFRSTDRGDTWQERALPPITPSITDAEISFVSDREGWVASVGAQGEPQCAQQSLRLWHTADGGTTYDGGSAPNGLEARQCKAGLSFIDPQRGFIGAWAPATTPVIYRTTDGGRSWAASRPLPDPPGFTAQAANSVLRIGRVRAFGGTLLVAADGQTTAGGNLYVYRSTDGGTSWSLAATAPIPFSLAFVTASRWIQLSSPQDSRETTDAGSTWHPFTTDYSQAAPVAPSVVFADAEVGYASVRGGLKRTLDGGVHWTTLRTPGT